MSTVKTRVSKTDSMVQIGSREKLKPVERTTGYFAKWQKGSSKPLNYEPTQPNILYSRDSWSLIGSLL